MTKKPILMLVDDDAQVLAAFSRDVRKKYRKDYRIMKTEQPDEALEALRELQKAGDPVAMVISDQRMPGMNGVELLTEVRKIHPTAKRLLLTAYADTAAAIQAINDVQLDYYLMKPWDPPEEKVYPILDELLFDWKVNYRPDFRGLHLIGFQWSPKSHRLKDFLSGNFVPYRWHAVENDDDPVLSKHDLKRRDLPAVVLEGGEILTDPELAKLAEKTGMNASASAELYDVVIIGAGPAGLAAAVYGASEGLRTLLIERRAPGGQAGTSSRIENYLGFPGGLSGAELTRRATTQAKRLGAELMTPAEVTHIEPGEPLKIIHLGDGSTLQTRSVVISTGVDYRKLEADGIENFTGAGVYYGSAATEAAACQDGEVYIVGGGNSAGQAAVYLSRFAKQVYILIRRAELTETMSAYLIDQVEATPNINLCGRTVIRSLAGEERLEKVTVQNLDNKETREVEATAVYIFIGAKPYTDWLANVLIADKRGFLRTGSDLLKTPDFKAVWKHDRDPLALETSQPGILAAGDVRSGAMNRVASAVGEGAMAIKLVHDYLKTV